MMRDVNRDLYGEYMEYSLKCFEEGKFPVNYTEWLEEQVLKLRGGDAE